MNSRRRPNARFEHALHSIRLVPDHILYPLLFVVATYMLLAAYFAQRIDDGREQFAERAGDRVVLSVQKVAIDRR